MTVGSLFAGIGGFDLGFMRAGFEIAWQVEIDPFCRAVLAQHWPHVKRYNDVRTVHGYRHRTVLHRCGACLEAVDVICGGFPCQPHSLAGRRNGSGDERDLWPEFARLIRECQPRWVVAENVPGLLSSDAGRFFGTVLGDLAACGYDAEWDCLPASAFGAPHRRDRVWLVAYPMCGGREERALPEGRPRRALSDAARRGGAGADVAAADEPRLEGRHGAGVCACAAEWPAGAGDTSLANTSRGTRQWETSRIFGHAAFRDQIRISQQWRIEPDVGRVAHGVPARVDRLRGLGNAIVPQIAEWIAHRIRAAEQTPVDS